MSKSKKILLLIPLMCIALTACTEPTKEDSSNATPTEAATDPTETASEPTPTDAAGGREGRGVTYLDENPEATEASPEVDTEYPGNSIDGLVD